MLKLKPINVEGREYEVDHLFPLSEIIKLMRMPKIGIRISFRQAYALRWMEGSYRGRLFTYRVQSMPLYDYCVSRGYYIEFTDEDIEVAAEGNV